MPLCLTTRIDEIARAVCRRPRSLFERDLDEHASELHAALRNSRVLVTGGAGSIGSATVLEILKYGPSALCIVDPNENNLVEMVRSIRNGAPEFHGELRVEPLDYGSPLTSAMLEDEPRFDFVLSFAALKHVRSAERDDLSLLRLLEVNLLQAEKFLWSLRRHGHGQRGVFFVSTDKAARPVSLMGASKRIMEMLLWSHGDQGSAGPDNFAPLPHPNSARFANVAFSDGSLPWSFLQRMEKRQPLAAPGDLRRYFLTPSEAGQFCLLASILGPANGILIPRLDPKTDLLTFTAIAAETLSHFGLKPVWYEDPDSARASVSSDLARGEYPVLVTASDTSGEKEEEEFVGANEQPRDAGLHSALSIPAIPAPDTGVLRRLLEQIERATASTTQPDISELISLIRELVPDFEHRRTSRSLDAKL